MPQRNNREKYFSTGSCSLILKDYSKNVLQVVGFVVVHFCMLLRTTDGISI